MDDDTPYQLVTVKRSRGGAVEREWLKGKEIKVKTQSSVKTGDFLISKRQIVHGACALVPKELEGAIVSNEYAIMNVTKGLDPLFLNYLADTVYFQQTCFHSSIGVHVEKMIFKLDWWYKWPFNLPPIEEQNKIARMLSKWDRAIESTEKLIENSRQQKKALMQQLLTGKKRLPGSAGNWKTKRLRDIAKVTSGGTPNRENEEYWNGDIPWITTGEIDYGEINSSAELITKQGLLNSAAKIFPKGTLLMAMYGQGKTRGRVGKLMIEAATNQACAAIVFKPGYSIDFYYQYLESQYEKVRNIGNEGTQKNLNAGMIKSLYVPVPSIEEQINIAGILSKMDKIIALYAFHLEHKKCQKQALMQQLLTGKRRVKVN